MKKTSKYIPELFIERLKRLYDAPTVDGIIRGFSKKRPTTIRVNLLKTSILSLIANFEKLGIKVQNIPWSNTAFIIKNISLRDLSETDFYKQGLFYVQSLSSMIPPLVLNPQKNEKILDITAAPGSKTTQIAAMMENTGEIIANDNSHIRLLKLEANLKTQGVTNVKIKQKPGQIIWRDYPEYFDKALVDVPCSMEGRFCIVDPKTFRNWSLKKIKILTQWQKFLLRSAISSVKPGGSIVYSTCTLAPEENEGVVDWILNKEKNCLELEYIDIPNLNRMNGITKWQNQIFEKDISKCMRILPDGLMEGFFVASFKKTASNV